MHESNYYVEFQEPVDEQQLRAALTAAGLEPRWLRKMMSLQEGIAVTQTLMEGIWKYETGQDRCQGNCQQAGDRRHVEYGELNDGQRHQLAADLSSFMDQARQEHYYPSNLEGREEFNGIALRAC